MSKAFVAEPDGWLFCRFYQETCRYADEAGECVAPECEREAQWLAGEDADDGPSADQDPLPNGDSADAR